MINVNTYKVNETYDMIEHEKLDVRTITLDISLLDCVDSNLGAFNEKIYKKITTLAKDLVSTGQDIEADFGIPIVDKRISIIPTALAGGFACKRPEDFVTIAKTLDLAAKEVGVNFISSYSALVSRGMTRIDKNLILSILQALSQIERVHSSVNVGSTKTDVDMDAVELVGRIAIEVAEITRDYGSLGCARLVVFCNVPDDNSFMAGAFHGVTESEAIINAGVSDPGVARVALAKVRDANSEVLYETIKRTALKTTHVGQLVVQEASKRMGISFGIIDLSLAPTLSVGNSVAEILEEIGLERVGIPGTTTAFVMFNDQVKRGDVMASSYVDGLSGVFVLVSEDQGMIDAVSMGAFTIEKPEATTCIRSVGLDMIVIPGDAPSSTVIGTIADEAVTGMVNQKTTAVRLVPVVGKKVRETAELNGLLGYAPVMPVNTFSCRRFVTRGGGIPAPIHSLKN